MSIHYFKVDGKAKAVNDRMCLASRNLPETPRRRGRPAPRVEILKENAIQPD